jgi:hypothetical protein
MYAKDIISQTLDTSDQIMRAYVTDLDEADLTVRPAPGMNPIAWQLGHLLSVERKVIDGIKPGSCPELPAGFDDAHGKEAGLSDDTSKYLEKSEYLALWDAQRAATKAVLAALTPDQMQASSSNNMRGMCPTTGHWFNFMGSHVLMHVGQFVPIRRKQGKPVVI